VKTRAGVRLWTKVLTILEVHDHHHRFLAIVSTRHGTDVGPDDLEGEVLHLVQPLIHRNVQCLGLRDCLIPILREGTNLERLTFQLAHHVSLFYCRNDCPNELSECLWDKCRQNIIKQNHGLVNRGYAYFS